MSDIDAWAVLTGLYCDRCGVKPRARFAVELTVCAGCSTLVPMQGLVERRWEELQHKELVRYLLQTEAPWLVYRFQRETTDYREVYFTPSWVNLLLKTAKKTLGAKAWTGKNKHRTERTVESARGADWPKVITKAANDDEFRDPLLALIDLGAGPEEVLAFLEMTAPELVRKFDPP